MNKEVAFKLWKIAPLILCLWLTHVALGTDGSLFLVTGWETFLCGTCFYIASRLEKKDELRPGP
jgi:hypothetical protein